MSRILVIPFLIRVLDIYEIAVNFNDAQHQGDKRKRSQQCSMELFRFKSSRFFKYHFLPGLRYGPNLLKPFVQSRVLVMSALMRLGWSFWAHDSGILQEQGLDGNNCKCAPGPGPRPLQPGSRSSIVPSLQSFGSAIIQVIFWFTFYLICGDIWYLDTRVSCITATIISN